MRLTTILVIVALLAICAVAAALWLAVSSEESPFKFDIGGQTPRASGGEDSSPEKEIQSRLSALAVFVGGVFALLFGRLWSMQLVSQDEYERQARANRTRTVTTRAARGRILDRNGDELVGNRPSLTVTAERDVLDDEVEMRLLANLLGMPYIAVKRKIQSEAEGAQAPRPVGSDATRRQVAFLGEHADVFEGVRVEERVQRYYPKGNLAAHVLGYTGALSQEQFEANQEANDPGTINYEAGDIVGQAGVEYQYESVLQGVRGERVVYVDSQGRVTEQSTSVAATSGSDIVLTIDPVIQKGAEEGLARAIAASRQKGNEKCKSGACLVLDATNGEILAMASAPTFSPSAFVGGISSDDWDEISSEDADWPLMNRAVTGQYMSASTIKPLSTFAALNFGVANDKSTYECTGFWTGFGKEYGKYCWNHYGHGWMDLRRGIIFSCDVVFYEIAKAFALSDDKKEALQQTFRRWGLGTKTGVDLPAESGGRIPDAKWKREYFSDWSEFDREWQMGDTANIVIGQGDLLVTPLQMACVYMGIANRGTIWRPHILRQVQAHDGGSVISYKPEVMLTTEESSANFDLVQDALKGVIYEEDYTLTRHFENLDVVVAGKTGSGEFAGESATGWFCAYAPAESPKYVVAAVIEKGGFGATSAMYAVRDTLGAIYGVVDSYDISDDMNVQ